MTSTLLAPDGVAVTAQQERQARAAQHGGGAGRPLGGRSGFRADTPAGVLTATSTTWTLGPCSAMIDPGATAHQGMYGWATDANISGAITPADSTYDRKDIVYIQINDSTAGDGSGAVSANVLYAAGPADGTLMPPALTGTRARSFLVGTITVPKVGGGLPTAVRNPAVYVTAGGVLPVVSQPEMEALTPYAGMEIYRTDLDLICRHNGTAWSAVGAHEEYTSNSLNVTSNSPWGPGVMTLDAGNSRTTGFGSWPTGDVFQASVAGLYAFHWALLWTPGAGPCYMSIRRNPSNTTLTSHQWPNAYEHDLTLPAVRLAANEQVKLVFVQTLGSTIPNIPHRVRVTKVA